METCFRYYLILASPALPPPTLAGLSKVFQAVSTQSLTWSRWENKLKASSKIIVPLFQLRDFQNSHSNEFGSSTRAVEQALEAVENNVKWMEDNYNVVAEWLNQRV